MELYYSVRYKDLVLYYDYGLPPLLIYHIDTEGFYYVFKCEEDCQKMYSYLTRCGVVCYEPNKFDVSTIKDYKHGLCEHLEILTKQTSYGRLYAQPQTLSYHEIIRSSVKSMEWFRLNQFRYELNLVGDSTEYTDVEICNMYYNAEISNDIRSKLKRLHDKINQHKDYDMRVLNTKPIVMLSSRDDNKYINESENTDNKKEVQSKIIQKNIKERIDLMAEIKKKNEDLLLLNKEETDAKKHKIASDKIDAEIDEIVNRIENKFFKKKYKYWLF